MSVTKPVIVIGGGIIGLSSAFYLVQKGYQVTVIDKSDMSSGCSYGNAGYVCPSHFVPLATPGIVRQGIKWMFNAKSPFYVQPRLNSDLIDWGLKFIRSATKKHVDSSAIPLRDISLLSKRLYEEWAQVPGLDFGLESKGLLEFFQTEENAHHSELMVQQAQQLGLESSVLSREQVQQLLPDASINILGAVYYACDAQLNPEKLMKSLVSWLKNNGAKIETHQEFTGFITEGKQVTGVTTKNTDYIAGHIVLAAGVWSSEISQHLKLKLPMVGGRGYSVTLKNSPHVFTYPVILSEARVAISPLDSSTVRFGGTMEITGLNTPPRMNRVQGILDSVRKYFPECAVPLPSKEDTWYGYRPCSADGLPYIGGMHQYDNVTIATGHSMLGVSLGAATGKMVSELVAGKKTSINIKPFDPERFS